MTREPQAAVRREAPVLLLAILALLVLGLVAGSVGWRLRPPAVPGSPEKFTARFGEPESEYDDEPGSGGAVTRSLVYERAGVRAVFAFDRRDKRWYFVGFRQPQSDQAVDAERAIDALAAHKPSSLFPLGRR